MSAALVKVFIHVGSIGTGSSKESVGEISGEGVDEISDEGVGDFSGEGVAVGLIGGVHVIKGSRVGVEGGIVNGNLVVWDCVPVANVEVDGDVLWVGS